MENIPQVVVKLTTYCKQLRSIWLADFQKSYPS